MIEKINSNTDRGEDWDQYSSCGPLLPAGIFDEYFYPERYDRKDAHVILAKRICEGCPVILECRMDALAHNDIHGIKGGMTPLERQEFLKRAPQQRSPEDAA